MKNMKRVFAFVLMLVMLIGLFPSSVITTAHALDSELSHSLSYNGLAGLTFGSYGSVNVTNRKTGNSANLGSINNHNLGGNPAFCTDPTIVASSSYTLAGTAADNTSLSYWSSLSNADRRYIAAVVQYYKNNPEWTGSITTSMGANTRGWIAKEGAQLAIFNYVVTDSSAIPNLITNNGRDNTWSDVVSYASSAASWASSQASSGASATVAAPTFNAAGNKVKLTFDGTNYVGTITDTSGALSSEGYNFNQTVSGVEVSQSGNTVTITASPAAAQSAGLGNANNGWSVSSTVEKEVNDPVNMAGVKVYGAGNGAQILVVPDPSVSSSTVTARNTATVYAYADLIGQASLTKSSADTSITDGNSCYSLAGAEYRVYGSRANAERQAGSVASLVTDVDGNSNTVNLVAGTYYVREYQASPGYEIDSQIYELVVEPEGSSHLNVSEQPTNDPVPIVLRKKDDKTTTPGFTSGKMSLEGAQYTFKYYPAQYATAEEAEASDTAIRTWVVQTNNNGVADIRRPESIVVGSDQLFYNQAGSVTFPLGTIVIQETLAPEGYLIDDTKYVINITQDGASSSIINAENEAVTPETPIMGGVKVRKTDAEYNGAQGNASLEGAIFGIVNKNGKQVTVNGKLYAQDEVCLTITTNADGVAQSAEKVLPYGNYQLREIQAPVGYKQNTSWTYDFTIAEDGQMIDAGTCEDEIKRGGLSLRKMDSALGTYTPYGDASFEGMVFEVVNASTAPVIINGTEYAVGSKVMEITTDENGIANTGDNILPYGIYRIREISVPNGCGYSVNETFYMDAEIIGVGVQSLDACPNYGNIFGAIKIHKVDANRSEAIAQGDASLSGAHFAISNKSAYAVVIDGVTYNVDDVVVTIETDENGIAQTDAILPMGTYSVKEVDTPSTGYMLNSTWSQTVSIRENNNVYELKDSAACPEEVVRGSVQIQKYDKAMLDETGDFEQAKVGPGGMLLKNAEITVINRSASAIFYDGQWVDPYAGEFDRNNLSAAGIVTKVYTNDDGIAVASDLPYGTYEFYETSAPSGYMVNDEWSQSVEVHSDGIAAVLDEDRGVVDELSRTDIFFNKEGVINQRHERLPLVAFRLTNNDTGESHVVVTDLNGTFDSSTYAHSQNTNANDAAVDARGNVDPSLLDYEAGVWFGGGTVLDSMPDGTPIGAFPYSKTGYTLEELRTPESADHAGSGNDGWQMVEPWTVMIPKRFASDAYFIGTVTNTRPESMSTTLTGKASGSHEEEVTEHTVLVDEITYAGLTAGKSYTVRGYLVDQNGDKIMVNGAPVEAEKSFRPAAAAGTVKVEFPFDAREYAGGKVIAFEFMYAAAGNLISSHEDVDDENQTVSFPTIRTSLHSESGTKEYAATETTVIVDTIYYDNLIPGNSYTATGVMFDKSTGNELLDVNGNEIQKVVTFVPDAASGSVDVTFRVSGSVVNGKEVVAFETVSFRGAIVARHEDIDDESQTVRFPSISTTLLDANCKHITNANGVITLTDTVHYYGLGIGNTYTVNGRLVVKATGENVLDEANAPVTNSVTFTATENDGTVSVEFTFDASKYAGEAVVGFEDLCCGAVILAEHHDLDDEEQTVYLPKISTLAYGEVDSHEIMNAQEITIHDKVSYEGLIAGETYKVDGRIMDKATGEALKDKNGREFTASKTFKADEQNGFVILDFKIKSDDLEGKTLVAFESVSLDNNIIGTHEDIDSEEQSIRIPKVRTKALVNGSHTALASEDITIADEVMYEGLEVGATYTATATLVHEGKDILGRPKAEVLKDSNDNEIIISTDFVPTESNSSVIVNIPFDASEYAGKNVVVFEEITRNGVPVAEHKDLTDESQTIHFPTIGTKATSEDGMKYITVSDDQTTFVIIDIVNYENLIPGNTYKVSGTLHDKADGSPIKDGDEGQAYVVESEFTAPEASGSVEMKFEIPVERIAGKTVVAFETMMSEGNMVAIHQNLDDKDQTVEVSHVEKIFKCDASDYHGLEGAIFEISDLTSGYSSFVQRVTSDADGNVFFNGLPGHEYSVKELKAPAGYQINVTNEYFVKVEADGTLTGDVQITNVHGGTVIITKTDVVTGDPVADCEVSVYKVTKVNGKDQRELVFKQNTDARGRIYFYTAEPGNYIYKETKTCYGYYLNEDEFAFTIADDLTVKGTVHFSNVPFGTAVIKKTDKSGAPLKGAEIAVYSEDGKFLGKGVSAENGRVYFVSPGPGKYYFVETKAPQGYVKSDVKHHFTIADDYTITGSLTIVNDRNPSNSKTGDTTGIILWVAAASVGMIGAGAALYFVLKKRKKDEAEAN